jgi:hypothetical protein
LAPNAGCDGEEDWWVEVDALAPLDVAVAGAGGVVAGVVDVAAGEV